jgi:hypothetical protein
MSALCGPALNGSTNGASSGILTQVVLQSYRTLNMELAVCVESRARQAGSSGFRAAPVKFLCGGADRINPPSPPTDR